MDTETLAQGLKELIDRERAETALISAESGRLTGSLLPQGVIIAQLEAAAILLRALCHDGGFVPIFPGDDVDVRHRVIEHYGDSLLVEGPSLRGTDRRIIGPGGIVRVIPRPGRRLEAPEGR